MTRTLVLALATLAATAASAPAQDSATARAALAGLPPRLTVRLEFRGGTNASGRLAFRDDTVSVYAPWGVWRRFGADSVVRVWRSVPGDAGAGAKRGAIAGAVMGGLGFLVIAGGFCGDPDGGGDCTLGTYAYAGGVGALFGAVVGALLGAIINALAPGWQQVFPAP